MNKIVVSIVLAVLSLMVTIVSFIINDIAAYRQWTWDNRGQISEHLEIRERLLPPEEIVPCRPERQNIMKEYRLQTGAPKNRAAKVPSHGRIKSAHLPGYRAFPEMSGPG